MILFSVIALEKFAQTSKYMTSGIMTDDSEDNCFMGCDVIYHHVGDGMSETSVHFCEILWYQILEDRNLHINTGVHKSQVPGHPGK